MSNQAFAAVQAAEAALVAHKSDDEVSSAPLRAALCRACEAALLLDLSTSAEVLQTLWNGCFYNVISNYRRRIVKYTAAREAGAEGADASLAKAASSFEAFLRACLGFYNALSVKISAAHGDAPLAVLAVSRCSISGGDACRYLCSLRSAAAPDDGQSWGAAAQGLYSNAARLAPTRGEPHNQAGILALDLGDPMQALHSYARAVSCAQANANSGANLLLLLRKASFPPPGETDPARRFGQLFVAAVAAAAGACGSRGAQTSASATAAFHHRPPLPAPDAIAAFLKFGEASLLRRGGGGSPLVAWGGCGRPPTSPPALRALSVALSASSHFGRGGWAAAAGGARRDAWCCAPCRDGFSSLLFGTARLLLTAAARDGGHPHGRARAVACCVPFLEWAASWECTAADAARHPPPDTPVALLAARRRAWAAAAAALNAAAMDEAAAAGTGGGEQPHPHPSASRPPASAEDFELHGFLPLSHAHAALSFSGGKAAFGAALEAARGGAGAAAAASSARARLLAAGRALAAPPRAGQFPPPLAVSAATGRFRVAEAGDVERKAWDPGAAEAQQQQQQQQEQHQAQQQAQLQPQQRQQQQQEQQEQQQQQLDVVEQGDGDGDGDGGGVSMAVDAPPEDHDAPALPPHGDDAMLGERIVWQPKRAAGAGGAQPHPPLLGAPTPRRPSRGPAPPWLTDGGAADGCAATDEEFAWLPGCVGTEQRALTSPPPPHALPFPSLLAAAARAAAPAAREIPATANPFVRRAARV